MMKHVVVLLILLFSVGGHSQKEKGKETGLAHSIENREVIYKIVNNDTLKLYFFYPTKYKKKKKYATMIFFFGGGWTGGKVSQFEDQAKYFASRGLITVLADYRVKSRHQTTPFEAVNDAKSAIRYLRINAKELSVHPDKIIASGGSAGGHLAAATAMIKGLEEPGENLTISSEANALVLFNPVVDMSPDGFANDKVGDRYAEISPMQNVTKEAPPTIFFLGTKDKIVPVANAEKFKSKMQAVGNRCDLHLYEEQPHGFFNKGRQKGDIYYKATVHEADLFLQSLGYLKGKATL